ncbi:MAG TPA: DUF2911 domain-containing protein [Candidatus Acidoferrum sp.]|nr:DUF2911 domain-containing protein [Candidatus Acidoferrum sp.]
MQKRIAIIAGLCVGLALLATQAFSQMDKSKRPSPPAQATCDLGGGNTLTVDYSSPRAKGRKIFGGLVPYGKEWRAGANEATTFVTTGDVKIGDKDVPAGHYTLFTIPEEHKWTLIISKKTGEWGIPYPGEKFDFARTEMTVASVPEHVEDFAIAFEKSGNGCKMDMTWENTRASVEIRAK